MSGQSYRVSCASLFYLDAETYKWTSEEKEAYIEAYDNLKLITASQWKALDAYYSLNHEEQQRLKAYPRQSLKAFLDNCRAEATKAEKFSPVVDISGFVKSEKEILLDSIRGIIANDKMNFDMKNNLLYLKFAQAVGIGVDIPEDINKALENCKQTK